MQVYAEKVESLKKSLLKPILLTDFVNLLIDNFLSIYSFCFIKWSLPMLTKIKTLKDKIKRHQAAQCKPWRCYSELTSAHRGVTLHCWHPFCMRRYEPNLSPHPSAGARTSSLWSIPPAPTADAVYRQNWHLAQRLSL